MRKQVKRGLSVLAAGMLAAAAAVFAAGCGGQTGKAGSVASTEAQAPLGTSAADASASSENGTAEASAEASAGETTVFVDDIGREVELSLPVTRACVANRYNNELIRAVGAGDCVVGVDIYTSQDSVYWPRFGEEETFGKDEYDYEKIIALDPQVLVVPKNGVIEESIEKLEPFGIQVVVITGWDNADVPKQIRLCGELFGREEEAEELVQFYQEPVNYISRQLEQVKERKTVYWEYGGDYTTCIPGTSNDGWHNMIQMAGGENIFGDASLAGKDIDPEQILEADPDLIVKIYAGEVVGNSGVFTAPPQEEFAGKAQIMLARPGWKDLTAVKEGNFYLNTAFMSGGLGKMVGAAYMAKWLYPELMTDLDPDQIFADWMAYQGFTPNAPHVYHVPAQE